MVVPYDSEAAPEREPESPWALDAAGRVTEASAPPLRHPTFRPSPGQPQPQLTSRAPGLSGVIALPGIALWRRLPIVGALLMIAGVMAPAFVLVMVLQHADDLIGLFTRPNILRGVALVAIAAITSRLIAVWLTADSVRDRRAQHNMRLFGSLAVAALAVPVSLTLIRIEQANNVVAQVFQQSPDAGGVTVAAAIDPLADQFHTVLLMGSDEGADRLGLRTDTMIIALVHEDTGRTALVSVPRNLKHLQFPPDSLLAERYPDGFEDDEDGLINALYIIVENDSELRAEYETPSTPAGVHALMQGLSYSLGITIDDFALINSCGFVQVVDAIGGITIDLESELPMPGKLRCSNYHLEPTIGPGLTYMDGTKALGYVRSRLGDSDYQRMGRQRLLLQSIVDEIGIDDLLLHFDDLAGALADNVETSMTLTEARTLLAVLQNTEQQFTSVGLTPPLVEPGKPDYDEVKALLQQIRQSLANGTELDLPTADTVG